MDTCRNGQTAHFVAPVLPQEGTCNLSFKPGSVRQEIPDDLLCRGSGARSWRRARQHKLGAYLAIDLNAARALAGKALRAVAEGKDPAAPSANTMLMTIAWMFLPRTIAMLDMLALQIDQPRYPANAATERLRPSVLLLKNSVGSFFATLWIIPLPLPTRPCPP